MPNDSGPPEPESAYDLAVKTGEYAAFVAKRDGRAARGAPIGDATNPEVMELESLPTQLGALSGYMVDRAFLLERCVVDGRTAATFEARRAITATAVVLRIIRAAALDEDGHRTADDLARTIAELQYSEIARLVAFGKLPGLLRWYAYEAVPGPTLAAELASGEPMDPVRAVFVARQIAKALAVAHRLDAPHMQLSPSCVRVTTLEDADVVQLMELGSAVEVVQRRWNSRRTLEREPDMGDPTYSSPEQAAEQPVGLECDVYSLGVMLFHMLQGSPPFKATFAREIALKHIIEEPVAPESPLMNTPQQAAVWALLSRMLSKEPADRPTAQACADELRALREAISDAGQERYETRMFSQAALQARLEAMQHDQAKEAAAEMDASGEYDVRPVRGWRRWLGLKK